MLLVLLMIVGSSLRLDIGLIEHHLVAFRVAVIVHLVHQHLILQLLDELLLLDQLLILVANELLGNDRRILLSRNWPQIHRPSAELLLLLVLLLLLHK